MTLRLALLFGLAPLTAWAGSVTARTPWMRFLLPGIPAAGYMVLNNGGGTPATLTGAASPACGAMMLHRSEDSSGMASMMAIPSVTIPARGQLVLAPGGYHLMCMQPKMRVGETIQLDLSFADGASLTVGAPVYGAQTSP